MVFRQKDPIPHRRRPSVNAGRDTTPDTPAHGRTIRFRVTVTARPIEGLHKSLPARQGVRAVA
jgi:hypothetical protein